MDATKFNVTNRIFQRDDTQQSQNILSSPSPAQTKDSFYKNIFSHPFTQDIAGITAAQSNQGGDGNLLGSPIQNWDTTKDGYKFGVKTFYSGFHLGVDKIAPRGTPVYAPASGKIVSKTNGKEGGNTVQFTDSNGKLWRFLHLDKFSNASGDVKAGTIIGYVGNTGELTTGPHLHVDISNNGRLELNNHANFIDPDAYVKSLFGGQGINVGTKH